MKKKAGGLWKKTNKQAKREKLPSKNIVKDLSIT